MVEPNLARMTTAGQPFPFRLEIRADGQTVGIDCTLVHEDGTEISLNPVEAPVGNSCLVIDTDGLKPGEWTLHPHFTGAPVAPSNIISFTLVDSPWR